MTYILFWHNNCTSISKIMLYELDCRNNVDFDNILLKIKKYAKF